MRVRNFIFIFLLIVSCCEKETFKDCEIQQTFELHFKNLTTQGVHLVVDTKVYFVNGYKDLFINVSIDYIDQIFVMRNGVIIDQMIGKPNVCSKYNYYWQ